MNADDELRKTQAEVQRLRRALDAIGDICISAVDEDAATVDIREIAEIVERELADEASS